MEKDKNGESKLKRFLKNLAYFFAEIIGESLVVIIAFLVGIPIFALLGKADVDFEVVTLVGMLALTIIVFWTLLILFIKKGKRKKKITLPTDFVECRETVNTLDQMAHQYNNGYPKTNNASQTYNRYRYDYFWACYDSICRYHEEHNVFLYAGDCQLSHLKEIIRDDGPKYAAITIIGASATDFYMIGVCVRGMPILKKVTLGSKEVEKSIRAISGKLGTYFAK